MMDEPMAHTDYRKTGLWVSAAYLSLLLSYSFSVRDNIVALNPSEFAQFLGNSLGPLGLLWLILGFWQQGDELKASVEALQLQGRELQHSVAQQQALVDVTRRQTDAQIDALADEKETRRLARLPRLYLTGSGGMSSGADIMSTFNLHNIGADCSKVNIYLKGDESDFQFAFEKLTNGATEIFEFRHTREQHVDYDVVITFRLVDGSYGESRYIASATHANGITYTVEDVAGQ